MAVGVFYAGTMTFGRRTPRDPAGVIDVLQARGDPTPIGEATHGGRTASRGRVLYRIRRYGHDVPLPGFWILVGDEFRQVE